jgi:hypothetical protein
MGVRGRMHFRVVQFFRLRYAFQQQYHGASHSSYINGLVCCIKNQNRFLHQGSAGRNERSNVAADVPRSVGRKRSDRFGGMSPPVVYRLWSSCAHRPSLPATGGRRRSLAGGRLGQMVIPATDLAPASQRAREHASNVAPAVITSSSSKIRKLSTRPPRRIAKAPRTASHRSSLRSRCFSGRGRERISRIGWYGRLRRLAKGRPIRSTWFNPRSRLRCRCPRPFARSLYQSSRPTAQRTNSPVAQCVHVSKEGRRAPAFLRTHQNCAQPEMRICVSRSPGNTRHPSEI